MGAHLFLQTPAAILARFVRIIGSSVDMWLSYPRDPATHRAGSSRLTRYGGVSTHVLTAFRAGLGHSLFFILRRLGFDRRWFKMINADPTVVPLKAAPMRQRSNLMPKVKP